MTGLGKKPPLMASRSFRVLFDRVSKGALIDALWCACQLGTDESDEQIESQAARNVLAALEVRGDRILPAIREAAARVIDSD